MIFWATMEQQARGGKTIVFATHYLEEAQNFAHRIMMMSGGHIIADGDINHVRALIGGHTVTASFPADFPTKQFPGVQSVTRNGNRTVFNTSDSALAQ